MWQYVFFSSAYYLFVANKFDWLIELPQTEVFNEEQVMDAPTGPPGPGFHNS